MTKNLNKVMANIKLVLTLLFTIINSVIYCAPITIFGLTLLDLTVSTQTLNASLVSPSFTIQFTIQGSINVPVSNIKRGDIVFFSGIESKFTTISLGDNYTVFPNNNTVQFQLCIPLLSVNFCNAFNDPHIGRSNCSYNIELFHRRESNFNSVEISKQFPNSVVTVYSNIIKPQLLNFSIIVHPYAPLVSFSAEAVQFHQGFNIMKFNFNGINGIMEFEVFNFYTLDNQYIVEYLFTPETEGYDFTINQIIIEDIGLNNIIFSSEYIKNNFNITGFSLPKVSNPVINHLIASYLEPKSHFVSSTSYTTLIFDVYTVEPNLYVLVDFFFMCQTFYQNSTYLQVYCTTPISTQTNSYSISIYTSNSNSIDFLAYQFEYTNKNTAIPKLISSSYSVSSIDEYQPLYVELNYTFSVEEQSYFYFIFLQFPGNEGYITELKPNNIISGTIYNGVASLSLLFDSANMGLSNYQFQLTDSKQYNYKSFLPGVPTKQRPVSNNLTIEFITTTNIIDLSNNPSTPLSFILRTLSTSDTYLYESNLNLVVYNQGYNEYPQVSGNTNFISGNSGGVIRSSMTSDGMIETYYQSYAVFNNGDLLIPTVQTDVNLVLAYSYGNQVFQSIVQNMQCYTILVPDIQPTILTEFNTNTTFPVNSSEVSNILFNLEFKGELVLNATIIFYQTNNQQNNQIQQSFNCNPVNLFPTSYPYPNETKISQFTCEIPILGLPSQTQVFFLQLNIKGITTYVYNVQLQESGYPSSIIINGPSDTGLVPNITSFQTEFISEMNVINIYYNYTTPPNIPVTSIIFTLFNTPIFNSINGIGQISLVDDLVNPGLFQIDLNRLAGFDYSWENFGIFVTIPSPVSGVNYQFPFDYLNQLDNNNLNLQVDVSLIDFNGPRLVDLGILNYQDIYDTTNEDRILEVYFDITDDLTGFNKLYGFIKSTEYPNNFQQPFNVYNTDLQYGNINNGRYLFNFTLPQYSTGNFSFQIQYITDNNFNNRSYTDQNLILLSTQPYSFTAVSDKPDPNNPTILNISNQYNYSNYMNDLSISFSGLVSSIILIPNSNSFFDQTYPFHPIIQLGTSPYLLSFNPPFPTSSYTFSICINSQSLSSQCYTWLDLETLGFSSTILSFNSLF